MTQDTDAIKQQVAAVSLKDTRDKTAIIDELISIAKDYGYDTVDIDTGKPWGAFVRFDTKHASHFIASFFPDVDISEVKLGREDVELSPKFLLVSPGARLSWQRHERRAERWSYITDGAYHKSLSPDEQGDLVNATSGDSVQFAAGECHRLVGAEGDSYTLVAEIWQHVDHENPSTEDDIERLDDDYDR